MPFPGPDVGTRNDCCRSADGDPGMTVEAVERAELPVSPTAAARPSLFRRTRGARSMAQRLIDLLVVLFLVSVGTFGLLQLTSGDPAIYVLGENATPASVAAV